MVATLSLLIIVPLLPRSWWRPAHAWSTRQPVVTPTLGSRGGLCFSETAGIGRQLYGASGPHRGELDTVRRDDRAVPRAIVARRLADNVSKRAAEGAQAGEA